MKKVRKSEFFFFSKKSTKSFEKKKSYNVKSLRIFEKWRKIEKLIK